jgi:hypothetical protein
MSQKEKKQPSIFKSKKEEKSVKGMVVYRKQVYLIAILSPSTKNASNQTKTVSMDCMQLFVIVLLSHGRPSLELS